MQRLFQVTDSAIAFEMQIADGAMARTHDILMRMKTLIETGKVPHDAAQPGPLGIAALEARRVPRGAGRRSRGRGRGGAAVRERPRDAP